VDLIILKKLKKKRIANGQMHRCIVGIGAKMSSENWRQQPKICKYAGSSIWIMKTGNIVA
jgi:hypothetical protein